MSSQQSIPKPAPAPSEASRFYWEAARHHRLVVQRCDACGRYVHWPQLRCPQCGSERLSEAELSGKGTVYSFCIVHHVFHPAFAEDVPYALALIELAEQAGLRMVANIVGCTNEDVRTGMAVEVVFEEREGYTLPQFRPATSPRGGTPQ